MSWVHRLYFNAMLGALGGLLGWMLFGEFVAPQWHWSMRAWVGGGLIGAVIGYFVVGTDALLVRAPLRFIRQAAIGVLLGGAGGALGFWLGERVHYMLVPATGEVGLVGSVGLVLARALGWALFGMAVGCAEGVAARSARKLSYGAIGGTLGGLVGGAVFGTLMVYLEPGERSYLLGQALGLMILGACIAVLIALVEEALKPAALLVVRGWQEGRQFPILKARTEVGRDEGADILLLRDMGVAKRHLVIERHGEGYRLASSRELVLINGQPARGDLLLADGDRMQLGGTVVKFLQRTARGGKKKEGSE